MRGPLLPALLVGVLLLAGCATDLAPQDKAVQVEGKPDGFLRTNTALKILVSHPDGSNHVVALDRAEWYVAGIEKEITFKSIRHVAIQGIEKASNFEVLVHEFATPDDFDQRFRYENLRGSHSEEELAAMDEEYQALLDQDDKGAAVGTGGNPVGVQVGTPGHPQLP
ncbi:MAG TPA: hypothetical protein VNZ52_00625 [Candidatus Thermoplasmatota archaeon]|nr:hypothetical protein [Candidatus Thermoplasmatota archaeon]